MMALGRGLAALSERPMTALGPELVAPF